MNYIAIALIVLPLLFLLNRRYETGLVFAGFLLVLLTSYLSIPVPGNLLRLTIHRIILLCLVFFWLKQRKERGFTLDRFTLFPQFIAVAAVNFVSMLLSVDVVFSFKTYLSFTLEMFLYFAVLSSTLKQAETGIRLLKAVYAGLLVTAILGIIEKKTGFNPVDAWLPGYVRKEIMDADVMSTFPHRIHFGLAMAMAAPLALGLSEAERPGWRRYAFLFSLPAILIACYFSDSRGPWLAALLAAGIMFFLGNGGLRRKLLFFAFAGAVALALKPGVRDTLDAKARETRDRDSFKGQTYQYRWDLWRVAYSGIRKSLKTLAVGTGPGTSEVKSYEIILTDTGEEFTVGSWDNEYAAILIETGFAGLAAALFLHYSVIRHMVSARKSAGPGHRGLMTGLLAGLAALIFMMTNVKMFSVQVNYMMWMLVAAGLIIGPGAPRPVAVRASPRGGALGS
jgi:hypothetical protein